MSKYIKYFLFFVVVISFTTCKKYPEDKFISFETVKMRLEGEWQLERIEINDENVGYKYSDSLAPLTIKDYKLWFKFGWKLNDAVGSKEKVDLLMINKFSKTIDNAVNDAEVSGLGFSGLRFYGIHRDRGFTFLTIHISKKKFPINDSIAYKILTNLFIDRWNIRMLHNKNLILEKIENDIKHRLYLKKTRNK